MHGGTQVGRTGQEFVERRQANHENECKGERQALNSHSSLLSTKKVDRRRRFAQEGADFMAGKLGRERDCDYEL